VEEYALLANLKSHARRVAARECELAELLEANREAFGRLLEGLALRLKELARALGEGGELLALIGDGWRSARIKVKLAAPPADPRGLARSLLSVARLLLEAGLNAGGAAWAERELARAI
jgi:hypothetical protein